METEELMQKFHTGAVRGAGVDDYVRFDLIPPRALRRLAAIYAYGAKKYAPHNWEKGIPATNLLNHAEAHLAEWKAGDRSEDLLAKVAWNIFAMLELECTMPEMFKDVYNWSPLEEQAHVRSNPEVFTPILNGPTQARLREYRDKVITHNERRRDCEEESRPALERRSR